MPLFGKMPITITGATPQVVTPVGWLMAGQAVNVLQTPTYGVTVNADLALGNWLFITATANVGAWVLAAPTWNGAALSATNRPPLGMEIYVTILNQSGGAIGAFSAANPPWKGSSGFALPTNGQYTSVSFAVQSHTSFPALTPWIVSLAF